MSKEKTRDTRIVAPVGAIGLENRAS
jgi:hypothetical protein